MERGARHPFVLQLEVDSQLTRVSVKSRHLCLWCWGQSIDGELALTFIATKSPVTRLLPLYTTPHAPSPCDWHFTPAEVKFELRSVRASTPHIAVPCSERYL